MIFNKQALLALGIACAACPFSHASKGGKNSPDSSKAHKEQNTTFFLASAACAQKCMSAEFQPDHHLLTNAIQHCDAKSSRQMWDIVPVPDSTFVKFKSVGVGASADSTNGWCLAPVPQEADGVMGSVSAGAMVFFMQLQTSDGYILNNHATPELLSIPENLMNPGLVMRDTDFGGELLEAAKFVGDGWSDHDMCSGKLGLVSCKNPASNWYSTGGQLMSTYCLSMNYSSFLSVNEECTDLQLSTTSDGATAISRSQTFMAVTQEFIETIPPPPAPTYSPTTTTYPQTPTANPTMAPPDWYFWGAQEGEGGQLGGNQQVPLFYEGTVTDLSAGSRHTFLIDESGDAYAAGFIESDFSYKGHLGVDVWEEGSNTGKRVDKVIDTSGKTVNAPKFMKAYAGAAEPSDSGEMHSMLIDEDGNVYLSGQNNKGQLCLGDRNDRYEFSQVDGLPRPAVAGSILSEATLILLENGSVWGCGSNEFGELGLGPNIDFTDTPDNGNGLENIIDLASGYKFGIFLDKYNVVYGTGGNIYGQQCFFTEGEPAKRPTPDILNKVTGTVVQVAANRESSYFLFEDGSAVSCGRNDEGQLGDGTFINTSEDKPIVSVKLESKIRKIGTGPSAQSVFFVTDDSVYGAGIDDRFQLGINEMGSQDFPVLVDFNSDVEIDVISASGTHTVASGNFV